MIDDTYPETSSLEVCRARQFNQMTVTLTFWHLPYVSVRGQMIDDTYPVVCRARQFNQMTVTLTFRHLPYVSVRGQMIDDGYSDIPALTLCFSTWLRNQLRLRPSQPEEPEVLQPEFLRLSPGALHFRYVSAVSDGSVQVGVCMRFQCRSGRAVQFQMLSMRSGKPICAPPLLSETSPTSPLKQFQCSSD